MAETIHNALFLCTGNSARSIMAERLIERWGKGRFRGFGAGSHPKGEMHPLALEILRRNNYLVALLGAAPAHAAPAYLVDADWLAEHIDDGNLVVPEVRYHPHRYVTDGHIPGAVQVQRFRDLGDNAASPLMRFPSKDAFQDRLRRWGVNDDFALVLYDDSRTALASRLYFLLALYGFPMEQVKVLSQKPVTRAPGKVTLAEANADLLAEWSDVYDDVVSRRDPDVVLLEVVAQAGMRWFHFPVEDDAAPGPTFEQAWASRRAAVLALLSRQGGIAIHCRGGCGRTGFMAALILRDLGIDDTRADTLVKGLRPKALTLPAHTDYLAARSGQQPQQEQSQ